MKFSSVKKSFIRLYGSNPIFNSQYWSFDQAFRAAWDSVDYFQSRTLYGAAQELANLSPFMENDE
jgi:hypothetical protein